MEVRELRYGDADHGAAPWAARRTSGVGASPRPRQPRPPRLERWETAPGALASAAAPAPALLPPDAILRLLGAAGVAAALVDHTLALRGVTDVLGMILDQEPEPAGVCEALRRGAAALLTDAAAAREPCTADLVEVRTSARRYRLALAALPPTAGAGGGWVLAVVDRQGAGPVDDAELRARHRLSARELEVARLAAAGDSTARVARALRLSVHTVRHHLEAVYGKLGVHSRVALAARLAGAACRPTGVGASAGATAHP